MRRPDQHSLLTTLLLTMGFVPALFAADASDATREDTTWYQVEVIVFKHLRPAPANETWSAEPLTTPADVIAIASADEPQPILLPQALQLLADQQWQPEAAQEPEQQDELLIAPARTIPGQSPAMDSAEVGIPDAIVATNGDADTAEPAADASAPPEVATDDVTGEPLPVDAALVELEPTMDAVLDLTDAAQRARTAVDAVLVAAVLVDPYHVDAFSSVASSERALDGVARSLRRSRPYRVLWHESWRQPIDEATTTVLIEAGEQYGERFELEGLIGLSRTRFLHAAVDMRFNSFAMSPFLNERFALYEPLDEPATSDSASPDEDNDSSMADTDAQPLWALPEETLTQLVEANNRGRNYSVSESFDFSHSRRMRGATVHYIDHPYAGVIIRIDEYQLPEVDASGEDVADIR